MSESLAAALARIAATQFLLVGVDFDGTLAPIVARPEMARADSDTMSALHRVAAASDCAVAVISGRPLADLVTRCEVPAGVRLVGSHGAELVGEEADLLPSELTARRDLVRERLQRLAADLPGSLVERKPFGAAFHTRTMADRDAAGRVPLLVEGVLADIAGLHVLSGLEVVEVTVVRADKGVALELLRAELRATAVFFVGDDVTDERAFERLGVHDVGVKVGPGPTAAAFRVAGRSDVAPLLRELAELRSPGG